MPKKLFPTDLLDQAQVVLDAWNQLDPAATFGDLKCKTLSDEITAARVRQSQMNALEAQLTNLRNERDASNVELWDNVKRVRSAVKGVYGDDSTQYEMVGGTRLSERKPRTLKQPAKT
jgi:hypothetical protein